MACYNHPNAPTVANCTHCGVEMCGVCTRFLESGEYCEKCAAVADAREFIAARSQQLNKRKDDLISGEPSKPSEPSFEAAAREKGKDRGIVILGISVPVVMLFFSLLLYAFPRIFNFDADAAAAIETAQVLEDCRLVFEEIGYLLDSGELPDSSYSCVESNVPNIMNREGDLIRISHPNPEFHGLSAIYVTNESHEVIFVEQENVEV